MSSTIVKVCLLIVAFIAVTAAAAQMRHKTEREPKETEHASPSVAADRRDTLVPAGAFAGRPYWLALAQCGGIYFKLNELYTDVAVQARAVKPDPKLNTEYTKKLNDAIRAATVFFDGADRFLMADRGLERNDAILVYDGHSRAAGDRVKTIDAALSAARACPVLYEACQQAFPKACSESITPIS